MSRLDDVTKLKMIRGKSVLQVDTIVNEMSWAWESEGHWIITSYSDPVYTASNSALEGFLSSFSAESAVSVAVLAGSYIEDYRAKSLDFFLELRRRGFLNYIMFGDIDLYHKSGPFCTTSGFHLNNMIDGVFLHTIGKAFDSEISNLLLCEEPFSRNHGYVLLGMSGSGKSTLINHLQRYITCINQATKVTTRPPRPSMLDKSILVVTQGEFSNMARDNYLMGIHESYNNYYGFLTPEINQAMDSGKDLFFDTSSFKSALELRKSFPDYIRIVYIDASDDTVFSQLTERYGHLAEFDKNYKNRIISEYKKRMKSIGRMAQRRDEMASESDFAIRDAHFAVRQQKLRDYIMGQRFPGLIMPPSHPSSLDSDHS